MMRICSEIAFWAGVLWLGYVYVLYPLLLWIVGWFRSFSPQVALGGNPSVSVLISARNEERDIGWKIAETLAWEYPKEKLEILVASDASTDRTDEILRAVIDNRFRYIRLEHRQGKGEALNRLAALAKGDLLFFSDANSHIPGTCLQKIVRHFADRRVGAVTGSENTIKRAEDFVISNGTGAFLRYESLLNSLESKIGSVLVCDGSIFCIRRARFETLTPELANDFELPVRIGDKGDAILFEPAAISWEKSTDSVKEEFLRRERICSQGILGFWRLRRYIRGVRGWQFFSRKLLRWFGIVPLGLILISSAALAGSRFFLSLLVLQVIFYALGLVGWWRAVTSRSTGTLLSCPFYFLMANVGAFMGVSSALLFGSRYSTWDSAAHSRGTHKDSAHNFPCVSTAVTTAHVTHSKREDRSLDAREHAV